MHGCMDEHEGRHAPWPCGLRWPLRASSHSGGLSLGLDARKALLTAWPWVQVDVASGSR